MQFEARVLAGEVGRMLTGSGERDMGSGQRSAISGQPGGMARGNDGRVYRVMDAGAALAHAGVKW